MKKLFTALAVATLLLSACGIQQNTEDNQSEENKSNNESKQNENNKQKENEKQDEKDKHKVTKKNGVTYVDGHVFVNKKIDLPKDYAPGENATARNQLNKLIQDARNQDLDLVFRSGYRSYESQEQLYKDYVARDGEEAANQYSATPGNSEHQTGLAFDIGSDTATDDFRSSFGDTDEGKWMEKHAHEYGFIIRYLEGKEDITGYQYEPWHLRYVGKDLAQKIHQKNVTLEEYFDYGY